VVPGALVLVGLALLTATVAYAGDVPDPRLTPGAVASTNPAEVCESDGRPGSAYSRMHRGTNEAARRGDFARYGIPWSEHGRYEDDHLVPLCLGGADTAANRWPQPRWGAWNSYRKDELESYACHTVCSGRPDLLIETQRWFLPPSDWREAYRRIFAHRR
jgi:hypothetical protein